MQKDFWKNFKKPIMVLAPMSGVTDEACRLMFLKYGKPDVFFTEFISADALFSKKAEKYCLGVLKHSLKEKPIVAQIFGGKALEIEKAVKVIAKLGFDGVDINMGCPDRDVEKQNAGSALIKNPALAKEIIQAAKKGTNGKIPVSVKTRIGYDKNEITEWLSIILKENISALTVHFRTRNEGYAGEAHWEAAEEIVKLKNKISPETLLIGNGDIKNLKQAKDLVEKYSLDGAMVGRGAIGNPWFFAEKEPYVLERLNAIIEHAEILKGFSEIHFESIKKHFHAYTRGFEGSRQLRESLMKVKNAAETKKVVEEFIKANKIK
jgi:nifR3 family TIM-barrel protein